MIQELRRPVIWGVGLLLVWSAAAAAHDTWVLADRDRAAVGETVRVALSTGEMFPKSEAAAEPDRVDQWVLVGQDGSTPITGFAKQADELVASVAPAAAGDYVIAVALKPRFIEIEAAHFNEYLRAEFADEALGERRVRDAEGQEGREVYTKLAKAFVRVGAGDKAAVFGKPVGHPLEIVPLSNPAEWRVGDTIQVRVFLYGKPADGLRVSSAREGMPPHAFVQTLTTDDTGQVEFRLARSGVWYLRTHYIHAVPGMIFAESTRSTPVDWESYFASMTFRVQPNGAERSP